MTEPVQTPNGSAALSGAVADLAQDVSRFASEIRGDLNAHRLRLDEMERASLEVPTLARAAESRAPHARALDVYLRRGDDAPLRALGDAPARRATHDAPEQKALSVAADGGYLVDPRTADRIETILRGGSALRSLARTVQVEAGAYDVLIDHSELGATWAADDGALSETDTPTLARISIPLHELSALPKISQRLLDDAAFDLSQWLSERIAERFARAENAAFVGGTGSDEPTGFLAHPTLANASWAWGLLGHVATGTLGAFPASDPADALIDLIYALPAGYRKNAVFAMNSTVAGLVRKWKDADDRYLWTETGGEGQPARLFGYPVVIVEEMPGVADDATPIAFGDFYAGYTVVERPDLRLLRDPYSAKPHVLFYATKRVGGDVTDFAAIKLLKLSVA